MGKPASYHEHIGCHNCKYYHNYSPKPLCLFGEENVKRFFFDGSEEDIIDEDFWDRKMEEKMKFHQRSRIDTFGHCEEWVGVDL